MELPEKLLLTGIVVNAALKGAGSVTLRAMSIITGNQQYDEERLGSDECWVCRQEVTGAICENDHSDYFPTALIFEGDFKTKFVEDKIWALGRRTDNIGYTDFKRKH